MLSNKLAKMTLYWRRNSS